MNDKQPSMEIADAAAWVLRIGVVASAVTMLIGLVFSFTHGTVSVERMKTSAFEYRPWIIWQGIIAGHGQSIIEAGIYMLVFTPVVRVFTSMILFMFAERDRLFALITFVVLILTLVGLL